MEDFLSTGAASKLRALGAIYENFTELRTSQLFWKQQLRRSQIQRPWGSIPLFPPLARCQHQLHNAYLVQALTHCDALIQNILSWDL